MMICESDGVELGFRVYGTVFVSFGCFIGSCVIVIRMFF